MYVIRKFEKVMYVFNNLYTIFVIHIFLNTFSRVLYVHIYNTVLIPYFLLVTAEKFLEK